MLPPRSSSASFNPYVQKGMQPSDDVDATGPPPLPTVVVPLKEELDIMIDRHHRSARRQQNRNEVKRFAVVATAAIDLPPNPKSTSQEPNAAHAKGTRSSPLTLEQVLVNANCVMMLRRSNAVEDYNRRRRRPPSTHVGTPTDVAVELGAPDNRRTLPLCYVVGPNPVDRTNFALDHLQNFGNHDTDLPSVVVHWPLWHWSAALAVKASSSTDLAHSFLDLLSYRINSTFQYKWRPRVDTPLNLNVCVVLDDVQQHEHIQFFTNPLLVRQFVTELQQSRVAESLMVVICGPMPVANKVNGAVDAFVFRLP